MRGHTVSWALVLLVVAGCAAPRARVAGRVVYRGEPVAASRVVLTPDAGGKPTVATADDDGRFRAVLAPGPYRVEARAAGAPSLVAVPGRVPVFLPAGDETWLGLQAVPDERPTFQPLPDAQPGFGALSGTVRHDGRPVAGAVVNLYLDTASGLRGPGVQQSLPTGPGGEYAFDDLFEGAYHVVARKRRAGAVAGPVREGDLFGVAAGGPIPVRSQAETVLDLHLVRKERDDAPDADRLAATGTGVRGRVVDESGRPAAGVYVFAYSNRIIGHGKPDFLTLPTGPDGRFTLPLGSGGLFYLGARERAGGSPVPGERFGFYDGSPDHGLRVPPGRVVGDVRIVVRPVLAP